MKKRLSLFCFALATLVVVSTANAQIGQSYTDAYGGVAPGGQGYQPGAFQATRGDLRLGLPGRVWISSNYADRGLGYEGSYFTIGGKRRLFEDFLDGRWLGEARLHHSLDGGGFFANVGVERIFSLTSAGADVSLGFWFDYDDDRQRDISDTKTQVGVSAKIKTQNWDLLGNGYFSVGNSDTTIGDPTGVNCFYMNNIVITPGIDSALQGFDATLQMKPKALSMVNGTFGVGGYGYSSDIVDFFGGGRVRLGMQFLRGLTVNAEVNYDDRFDVTGVFSAGWAFGVNARGSEYASLGRDLESTIRNDHIVRLQQDVVYALDPDTGMPYNVWHVDNLADGGVEDGTVDRRFTTLAAAEAASSAGDIIFVHEGNGTSFGMDTGITLKDDQFFLGDGVQHIIPIQNGLNYILCNDIDGNRPTISGSNNNNAVTLANNNVVRGFIIDGDAGVGGMGNGIFGDGVQAGIIEDNDIRNAVLNGVRLQDTTGNWDFARNTITSNGFDGIHILDACDPDAVFTYTDNNVSSNGRDGIHMENYDATAITFLRNITDNNGRHGVNLEGYKNGNGNGLDLDFIGQSATGNNGQAIRIVTGDGNLRFINSNVTGNPGGGLQLIDWTTTDAADMVVIGTTTGGTSTFSNNLPGIGIYNELNGGTQRFMVSDTSSNNNLNGMVVRTTGVGTTIESSILDNISFNNNASDGMRFMAESGSTQRVLIDQPNAIGGANLPVVGNGNNGISFLVGNDSMGTLSSIDATVRNTNISGNLNGMLVNVQEDGEATMLFEDSIANGNTNGIVMNVNTNNNGVLSRLIVRNATMINNAVGAVDINTFGGSLTDVQLVDSVFNGGAGDGISVNAFGGPLFGVVNGVDNRTRLTMNGNTVTNFNQNGVGVNVNGDAHFFGKFLGNTIVANGAGNNAGSLPFFDGIDVTASGSSQADVVLRGNNITGNSERGVDLRTVGTSRLNSLWVNNDISANDTADDPVTIPLENNISDADVANAAGSNVCLAMSNNFFTNGFNPTNAGAVGDFVLELDGFTNGFNGGFPNITDGVFGPMSMCQTALNTEEAAFIAAGFPAIPD